MTGAPWYRRTLRWAQTNLTEKDPARYDADWWRDQWRRTRVQGVIVNAGGIVAYYPSKFELQHRAEFLGDGDLYGDIVAAARAEGLVVLARMDSNRAHQAFYDAHPDWFAIDASGNPYRAGDLYVACVSGPYYREYLPGVLEEIIERSSPDGITDNSWSGLDRDHICYCSHCAASFGDLPKRVDWEDPAYRRWIEWSYAQRIAVWDLNNEVCRAAGGDDCLWIGMNGGEVVAQSKRLRDDRAICSRAPIFMLDSQYRQDGFQANADSGKRLHGLLGWNTLIPESTAMYDAGTPTFRLGSKPEPEARMWAVEGFAGGIQPWWHHIGSVHEDRRQYATAAPLFEWHQENEQFLVDREPIASVGLLWSQRSVDFHGREDPVGRSLLPYRGWVDALVRARIPYLPVHADDIGAGFSVIVVPNVGVLTDAQCDALRTFVDGGGRLVVTGESGLYDEWGERRDDFPLGELLGVRHSGERLVGGKPVSWETYDSHSYLRIEEPMDGFDDTALLPFGGSLEVVAASGAALTYVPPFPIYPPEKSWMAEPRTDVPALVLGERTAYLAADLDRLYAQYHHPDHGRVLANLVRTADVPLQVAGAGVLDCQLYRQGSTVILHLVNLDQGGAWPGRLEELTPAGPFTVRVPFDLRQVRFLVARREVAVSAEDGWITVEVDRIADHEVLVFS